MAASCSARADFIDENLHNFLKHTGPSLSPFNAWVLLKGLETLPLRVARHNESAARIADFLGDARKWRGCSIRAAPTIRSMSSPSGR